jgi:hypothetical protein
VSVRAKGFIVGLVIAAAVAVIVIAASSGSSGSKEEVGDPQPAKVTPIKGTDLSLVTLSADAAKRLGIATAQIADQGSGRKVIPYDAVIYAADGHTFTYTSPKPLSFVRAPITVQDIRGDKAVLSAGPPAGTSVVTVGSQELFGTEYEVEED